jgi:hypothetical protein
MSEKPAENLTVLEATIRDHARELAASEWDRIHRVNLDEVLEAAGLKQSDRAPRTLRYHILEVDGVKVKVEAFRAAIQVCFLDKRQAELIKGISARVVSEAFRKIEDEQ